jgi:sugar lactone lactonase YvrE
MALDARADAGTFYRIDADGSVATIVHPVTISNGIEWSPDGSLMYYIDTATQRMDVFDFDLATGSAIGRRPFIRFDAAIGIPDGMTIDVEGHLWVAFYDGWAVRRFSPKGLLERTIKLPTARTTSCAFGGPRLEQLYVTSARDGLTPVQLAEQPHAGALFVIEPGVAGSTIAPFAG